MDVENVPAAHGVQPLDEVRPRVVEYVPDGHERHEPVEVPPSTAAYVPAEHAVRLEPPVQNEPVGQIEQVADEKALT